jgi:ribonuclease BN (tRNA processing enzyme)
VELIVLGAGGGWARPGGAACGYLLRHDGFNLWVDLGTGTMANLQHHVDMHDVHAVAISHRHFDHFLDIYPFYLARWYATDHDPIPLFAPPGVFDHARSLENDLPRGFVATTVEPGDSFEAGPFRVRTAPMRHPVPTMGMRFEVDGQALAYSADTGPAAELVALADGVGVLLSEATWIDRPPWGHPIHMTATEAGACAREAGVRRLVITHVWPRNDLATVEARASEAFEGEVSIAVEGMAMTP